MKILLTGKPHSGKTTLLAALLAEIPDKFGLVAAEVKEEGGTRIGFDMVDSQGRTAPLARTDHATPYPVGRYFVDVDSLDAFIQPLLEIPSGPLLYLDEIGQMQLYSTKFKELVDAYLAADNDLIGTITMVYDDDFIRSIRRRSDVTIYEITPDNRDEIKEKLLSIVRSLVSAS
jgi:nucleoside-triphosphatase